MKNFRKSRKALSPVVASIILIAVTVAVSIAVAAWMGGMSVNFMNTEQLSITNADFSTAGSIVLSVRNTGTSDVIITSATVNGETVDAADIAMASGLVTDRIPKNAEGTVTLTYDFLEGSTYQIRLLSTKGTWFPYNAVA